MALADMLVYADTSPACVERLDLACRLAHRFEAYMVAVCPEEGAAVGERVAKMLRQENLDGEWESAVGLPGPYVTRRAQAADLVILGQRDPDHATGLDAPQEVVLACGRPVLIVPYAGHRDRIGEVAVVAWNGSREAARAAQDALPLLAASASVTVLLVNPAEDADIDDAEDLVAHLARHGLNASKRVVRQDILAVSDTILAQIASLGADLLVMGAYGHSRLREMILGGVTRDILRKMSVPILMAH
jgi:nucleotide-binding universal stress UspA family protein